MGILMKSALMALLCCLWFSVQAAGTRVEFGEARNPSVEIAVPELLARAEFFDGQPVRIIGVAIFDFGFEGQSGVYSSRDDASLRTFNGVSLKSFSDNLTKSRALWSKFSGKFVLIEGTFHAVARQKLDSKSPSICIGCDQPGYIDDVHRVRLW